MTSRATPIEEVAEEYAFEKVIREIDKFKAAMLKRKIKKAKYKCIECEGMWHGRIVGEKKHLWLHCDGSCGRRFME